MISVDTWRHEVGEAVCEAGADLLNDAWGGVDPRLAEVAARYGAGLVCTHAGGAEPRTRPHRVGVRRRDGRHPAGDASGWPSGRWRWGCARDGVLIDPGHDFGKNTRHSLEATRRLAEMAATGWPVLVSLSNKDFVGRDAGPAGQGAAGRARWRRPRSRRGWARGCTGCTRSPRPGRCWTWWRRSPGHRPPGGRPPGAGVGRPGRPGRARRSAAPVTRATALVHVVRDVEELQVGGGRLAARRRAVLRRPGRPPRPRRP